MRRERVSISPQEQDFHRQPRVPAAATVWLEPINHHQNEESRRFALFTAMSSILQNQISNLKRGVKRARLRWSWQQACRDCALTCDWHVESLKLRCKPLVFPPTRASIWASILSSMCWVLPSDSSLALLYTPSPWPVFHFTPQRSKFLLSLSHLHKEKSEKKEADACMGRSCLPPQLVMLSVLWC